MTAHTVSILSRIAKTTSLGLGLLAAVQLSASYASTPMAEESEHFQNDSLRLTISVDGSRAVANNRETYYTPSRRSEPLPGTQIGGGHRGGNCNIDGTGEFMTLGPQSMVGLTTQVQPEFSWYISPSEEGASLTFRLTQFDENGQRSIVDSKQMTAQAGFMSYQPSDTSPLEVGRDYLWQIVLECDGKLLRSTSFVRAVPPSAELTAQLSTATTNAERAVIYSKAELWYDALAQVIASTTPDDETVRSELLRDLAAAEEKKDNPVSSAILLAILEQTDGR